ncbi:AAA family ATPase domain-containing protein [Desulfonema limicola]|uniref:AAA family ATPase domain-containing protein n=1 Tax=Desulfonema limicola TaxID=45656 RepID=A0A975B9U2_9BACT|nr:AAA-like domain-containing protein [Desulfonema limicola]QTA81513.1 AAA family ATPase domain-containing protein [Desulfonema limicola]
MRTFHSYGPVDCEEHFCVPRKELVESCTSQIIGNPDKQGHYFTIWAPRQTGKTWLMRQVKKEVESCYSEKFLVGCLSVQGVIMEHNDLDEVFFRQLPRVIRDGGFQVEPEKPKTWDDWIDWFSKSRGLFDKPLILFIDEFDSLPLGIIDRLVTIFRDMYLKHENYMIHGLALIGVRAVLGVESTSGSPFNIQKSLHVPNLTKIEVENLFSQYQKQSGQKIAPGVIDKLYESTRGQPGLISWFGELITEKFNPGIEKNIDIDTWNYVYSRACRTEWNNTLLNMTAKVKKRYTQHVLELFINPEIEFSLRADWCSYLYLNGVIDAQDMMDSNNMPFQVCCFSSPFIQQNIYQALTNDLAGDSLPILALDPLDDLSDVLEKLELDLPALLSRYKDYLKRLKAKGLNPWKEQPRRSDLNLREAAGHFHIYAWLQNAVGRRCTVSPEFPTGNGRVDIWIKCHDKQGIIEVKSFKDLSELNRSKIQAARYAKKLGLNAVTLAVFIPVQDEDVIEKLSSVSEIEGVKVAAVVIGWG